MYFSSELRLLRSAFEKCGVKTTIAEKNKLLEQITLSLPFDLGNKISAETVMGDIKPATVYHHTDLFSCRYIFFLLPSEEKILLIGPFVEDFPTSENIVESLEKFSLSVQNKKHLENYYANIPVLKKNSHLYILLEAFYEILWMKNGFKYAEINNDIYEQVILLEKNEAETEEKDILLKMQSIEKRYEFETQLMNAVSSGNITKAELIAAKVGEYRFEVRNPDRLRNVKNYCIIMNTLLRKAAEKGGVHPIYIDSISSDFALRIEKSNSLSVAKALMGEMFKSYCRLVKKNSTQNYSSPVQKAMVFIDSDLTADLSLKKLASLQNISASYLSALFKKETGVTLTDYVNNKRIKYAMQLLATTKLQIQTAAQYSGIDDVHYFTKLFKKYTGQTPKEYRQSIMFK